MFRKSLYACAFFVLILSLGTSYGATSNILVNPGFESSTTGNWTARSCTFTRVTSSPSPHSGTYSGRASGRNASWQGIQQDVLGKMVVGQTYTVSGYVRTSSSTSTAVHLSFEKTDGSGTTYAYGASGNASNSGWTSISGNYTLTVNGTLTKLLVYVEGATSGTNYYDIYLDDVNVFGQVPAPPSPSATGDVNVNTRHQVLEGFGAAGAWYENWLTSNTQSETIYNILFRDLGLDIYRIRNTYDYDSAYMSNTGTIVSEALERNPNLKILISSWSPPTYLKSTGQLNSGTLAGGPSAYVYDDFATWWADSITEWSSTYEVDIDYVSIQNEPDWNGNDRCLFDPTENSTNAGYDQAFEAVWTEFNSRWGSSMPKMLAPETSGFDGAAGYSIDDYLSAIINHSHVYGYAHHLYNCENGGAPGCGDQPDLYISDMTDFNSSWGSKPLFQTEYEHATDNWPDAFNLALLLHNSLTVEKVSVYLYWDLFWNTGGLVTLPSYGASTYTINNDYYGLKHFARFTDPGWQRTNADTNSTSLRISSFIDPTNQKLSAIIINTDAATDINLALSFTGFTVADGNVWRSTSSQNCVLLGSFVPGNQLLLPAKSVTTIQLFSSATPPPGKATSPSPSSGATGVGTTTDISWTAGSGATSHLVYFGTISPGDYQDEQTGTTFDTGTMTNGTTYYWRIDEKNTQGTTQGDQWSFTTIYKRSLSISSTSGGSVTQPGQPGPFYYDHGTVVDLNAVPSTGWHFVNWTGDTGTINNVNAPVTTITMNGNYAIQANFGINQYSITATAGANGSIDPTGTFSKDYGSSQLFTATPAGGYEVDEWRLDGGIVDGNSTTYTLSNITAGHTVTVSFKLQTFSITATAGANGSIDPTGTFSKDYGSSQLFTATPAGGYEVNEWRLDGGIVDGNSTTYTLSNITAGHTVTVSFKLQTFSITATAGANGSIDPTGTFSKDYGSSQLFTATPAGGYEVNEWRLDGGIVDGNSTTYTLSNITAGHTVTVSFKLQTFSITATAGANGSIDPTGTFSKDYGSSQLFTATPAGGYEVNEWRLDGGIVDGNSTTYTLSNITAGHTVTVSFKLQTFSITATAGANGSIDPTGTFSKDYGSSQLFTAAPDAGYEVDEWRLDGGIVDGNSTTYTLSNITAGHTVTVSFKLQTFSITATAGANGSIDPTGTFSKDYGSSQLFTATPAGGYEVNEWRLDGGIVDGNSTTYTLSNITAGHTVTVSFKLQTFSITATAGANGSIDPTGTFSKDYGSSQLFTATPAGGYEVNEWRLDGGIVDGNSTTYTLSNITAGHTVTVSFKLQTFSITATAGANGSIDPTGTFSKDYGSSQLFTATPAGGYEVNEWRLDGGIVDGNSTTYTLSNITAGHTVDVTFKEVQAQYYTISGAVTCAGKAFADVNVVGLGVFTDINGLYIATVASGFSGVVTPTLAGYTFDPNTRTYTNVTTSQTGQDYNALPSDNFNDNRRGRMWRYGIDGGAQMIWLNEGGNLLNLRALNLAYLPPFCEGYWTMDDNLPSTTVADSYANKNGTAQRSTSVLHTAGKIGGALVFNGSSDYVDLGNVIGTGAYTKVAWVRREDGATAYNIISGDAGHFLWAPHYSGFMYDNKLTAGHNSIYNIVQDTVSLDVNTWYQVAVTFNPQVNSGRMVLYKNGVEVNEANNVPTQGTSTKTYIGRFSSGYYMKGAIDNVMIFNRALAPEEIAALYKQDTVPPMDLTAVCVGHWKANDNAANKTVADSSGKGHDGTAQQDTNVLHTTGKINGALTFNGTSDYVDVGNVIGTGAYTKVAWVRREAGATAYNIISGDAGHFLWAPHYSGFMYNNKLTAGHNSIYNIVQDTVTLDVNTWYMVAVTFDPQVNSGRMVLYKDGAEVNEADNVPTQGTSTKTYIGRFSTGYYMKGAIDNAMIFNRALTAEEIAALYNQGKGTETIPGSEAPAMQQASFTPNGWRLDTARNLAVKVDFHYGDTSSAEGWTGMSVGDDINYVSISAGSDGNASYYYYEASVDGTTVSEKEPRTSNDGTLYITYDVNATARKFYLSYTGFGSENAYAWQATNPTIGPWASPVDVSLGGGAAELSIGSGKAYLDNFEMKTAGFLGWPPVNDINGDGYVDIYDLKIICDNWLAIGPGDIDNTGLVDFGDLAELGLAW